MPQRAAALTAVAMLAQLSLPGLDAPTPPKRRRNPALRGIWATHRLLLALFPQPHEAARIAETIDALRQHHGLDGQRLHADRLHTTLLSLGDYVGALPQGVIDAAMAAAATVVQPPMDIVFDRALSFAGSKVGNNAFVLCGRDLAAVSQLGQALGLALKRARRWYQPTGKPHMTMLYDGRVIEERAIEPIR